MYQRILVPLDGSELAEQVLPHVVQLAGYTGAEIVLVRIPNEPLYKPIATSPALMDEMRRDAEMGVQVYLEEIASELCSMGLKVSVRIAWGTPVAQTILDLARALNADLIAMSTHGRSGLMRLMIGSVADEIVRHSPVPVLLIHPYTTADSAASQKTAQHGASASRKLYA